MRDSRCDLDGLVSGAPGLGLGLTWILRTLRISPAALALMSSTQKLGATAMAKGEAPLDPFQLTVADNRESGLLNSRLLPI